MKDINYYQKLINNGKNAAKKYRRECADIQTRMSADKRFNILLSNTETLKANLVTNDPKPVIRTRFPKENTQNPQEKQLARAVGEIVERTTIFVRDNFDCKSVFEDIITKALLFGRGVPRVKYEPIIESEGDPAAERIGAQEIKIESVDYDEILIQNVKKWDKVGWVAFRHLMTKDDLKKRFGEEYAEKIELGFTEEKNEKKESDKDKESFAEVWEIWDKTDKKVVFIAVGYDQIISEDDDPYGLKNFFPIPEPLQFFKGKDLRPVPEFRHYSKIVDALEETCRRIDAQVKNIRSSAIAAAKDKETLEALNASEDNSIVTINQSLGQLSAAGGLRAMIMEYPNDEKIRVLQTLETEKTQRLMEIYEITGIADIMRGQSDPDDTARAQEIKGKFGSLRIQARQANVQNTIKECFKIITELVCEHYTRENLSAASSIFLPTEEEKKAIEAQMFFAQARAQATGQPFTIPAQMQSALELPTWEAVLKTLRNDKLRNYTIEVESTATVFDGDRKNVEDRLNLFKFVNDILREVLPLMQQNLEFIPAVKAQILFTIDAFPQSRILKEAFEESFTAWEARVRQPQPPQPSAEIMLASAEQMKAQADQMTAQARMAEAQTKALAVGKKIELDEAGLIKDMQKDKADTAIKAGNLKIEEQKAAGNLMLQAQKNAATKER